MQIRANANENQVISVSSAARERAAAREARKSGQQNRKTSIFAGDFGMQNDALSMRKQRARKKALKIISDVWDSERKLDQNVVEMKDKVARLHRSMEDNLKVIAEDDAQKEALRQQYGVEKDSQEQKDLELLERAEDAMYDPENVKLSEEEQKRLEELQDQPLTEYQQRCRKIDQHQRMFKQKNRDIDLMTEGYNSAIRSVKIERLKFSKMVGAQKKAEDIMEKASEDAINTLISESKDHVQEELEKPREEAKEEAEKKAEQEEKIEERKEQQAELEERIDRTQEKAEEQETQRKEAEERSREDAELLEGMLDVGIGGVGNSPGIKSEIKDMLHKMKVLEEDLKGSIVDEEV